jgi:hypothetical protein
VFGFSPEYGSASPRNSARCWQRFDHETVRSNCNCRCSHSVYFAVQVFIETFRTFAVAREKLAQTVPRATDPA